MECDALRASDRQVACFLFERLEERRDVKKKKIILDDRQVACCLFERLSDALTDALTH